MAVSSGAIILKWHSLPGSDHSEHLLAQILSHVICQLIEWDHWLKIADFVQLCLSSFVDFHLESFVSLLALLLKDRKISFQVRWEAPNLEIKNFHHLFQGATIPIFSKLLDLTVFKQLKYH